MQTWHLILNVGLGGFCGVAVGTINNWSMLTVLRVVYRGGEEWLGGIS